MREMEGRERVLQQREHRGDRRLELRFVLIHTHTVNNDSIIICIHIYFSIVSMRKESRERKCV